MSDPRRPDDYDVPEDDLYDPEYWEDETYLPPEQPLNFNRRPRSDDKNC